ncbi:MAG: sensor histidine kinase [Salinivenus sp.]
MTSEPASGRSGVSEASTVEAAQIVETLHEPLLVLDADVRIRQANPAFHEAFGTDPEALLGSSLFEVGGGHFRDATLRRQLEAVVESDASFTDLELDRTFEGLGRRVLRLNGRRLVGQDEGAIRVLLAIEDVTEQYELEEELRRHARELERSNADLEEFAYAASHDLQEPLRMVASYLQLLERRYAEDLDETAREFIEYAVDGARRMKDLINSLLHYSRIGRKEGEFREVDLGSLIDEIVSDLERRIEETDATVTRDSLPATYGVPDQLRRVFQNLIENALTYHGEARPVVHVSGTEEDGGVHLTVRDEGPGIPPAAQDKIFRIFKQLDPHGTGREGSGMGLSITRKIVERHEGTIWVDSAPGDGATFHVTFHLTPDSTP